MELIVNDEKWINGINSSQRIHHINFNNPHLFQSDTNYLKSFHKKLLEAYTFSQSTPLANEHIPNALKILSGFNLIIEKPSSYDESSIPITKYIVDTLLHYSFINNNPCNHVFYFKLLSYPSTT